MPATTRPMQNARKTEMASPARATQAPIASTRKAASSVPAEESDSDHGAPAKTDAPSAASTRIAIDPSRASDPGERGRAPCASPAPSTSRKPPQPTNAAAWLKKVAEGATLSDDGGRCYGHACQGRVGLNPQER